MHPLERAVHGHELRSRLQSDPQLTELLGLIEGEFDAPIDPKTSLPWAKQFFQSETLQGWLKFNQGDLFEEYKDPEDAIAIRLVDGPERKVAPEDTKMFVAAFIDGDSWKKINYEYGHEGGDEAIISLGQEIQSVFRNEDCLLRFGGDEFVVLMKDIPQSSIENMQESLAERLSSLTLTINNQAVHGSATIGLASSAMSEVIADDVDSRTMMSTISQAERNLVEAKRNKYQEKSNDR